jgi:hypothetical protein
MRAEKHLDKCDEDCKYASSGICSFGLRNKAGCFLDPGVRKIAADLIVDAKTLNGVEIIRSLARDL